jgi:NAD-dependent SIR2 family protein deacetylase
LLAREAGARIIEVNPEETPLSPLADASFRCPSAEFLPRLVDAKVRA